MIELIEIPLIPTGDMPTLHFSQADDARIFAIRIIDESGDSFDTSDYDVEFHLRKVDDSIVTIGPMEEGPASTDHEIYFESTEQLTACIGVNLGELVISDEDRRLGTLNFFVNVEKDPLINGLTSQSEIHNLRGQIEEIAEEVLADDYYTKDETDTKLEDYVLKSEIPGFDDYYTKEETDTKLADYALKSEVPDLNDYYTKSDTDTLLADKADVSDLPDMTDYYDKTETDNLLAYKADIEDLPDMTNYYNKTEIDNKIHKPIWTEPIPMETGLEVTISVGDYPDGTYRVTAFNTAYNVPTLAYFFGYIGLRTQDDRALIQTIFQDTGTLVPIAPSQNTIGWRSSRGGWSLILCIEYIER